MKLDTSSYYPKSHLDDEPDNGDNTETVYAPSGSGLNSDHTGESETESGTGSDRETITGPINGGEDLAIPEPSEYPGIDAFAKFLSWVLVPLLMPVYGIILIFNLSILSFVPFSQKVGFTLIVAAFNIAIPALLVLLLKRFGIVHDIGLNGRKERLIPYIITILCMGGTGLFLFHKGFPMWVNMFYIGGAVAGLIEFLVNFKWKISAHSAAIAGIVALLIHITHNPYPSPWLTVWMIIALLCTGILGSARLWLRRHTLLQVLAGYAVGFISVYLMMFIH